VATQAPLEEVLMRTHALQQETWFDEDEAAGSEPVGPLPRTGDPMWSGVAGAVAGAFGGVVALGTTDWMVNHGQLTVHWRIAVGQASAASIDPVAVRASVALAALAGAILGWLFGGLTRRLFPVVPRIVFGAIVTPALCTVVYAFILPRFAPAFLNAVPFTPLMLGALAYGVCVALMPPIQRSRKLTFG
jgi:hypothetical protein